MAPIPLTNRQHSEHERQAMIAYRSTRCDGSRHLDGVPLESRILQCPSAQPEFAEALLATRSSIESRFEFEHELPKVPIGLMCSPVGAREFPFARFTAKCVTSRCIHWSVNHCHLGHVISDLEIDQIEALEECPIRINCRWFAENGSSACRSCPWIGY